MNSNLSYTNNTKSESVISVPWYIILFAVICVFGMITNVINILVFANPQLKDRVYKCMLVSCTFELFYLAINSLTALIQCGDACNKYFTTLAGQIITVYFINYLSSVFALFCILIEIFLAFQRYTILINRPFLTETRLTIILSILFLFAAIVHCPTITNYVIVYNPSSETYMLTLNQLGLSNTGRVLKSISSWTRIALTLVVLSSLSILTTLKSKEHFLKRAHLIVQTSTSSMTNKNQSESQPH